MNKSNVIEPEEREGISGPLTEVDPEFGRCDFRTARWRPEFCLLRREHGAQPVDLATAGKVCQS